MKYFVLAGLLVALGVVMVACETVQRQPEVSVYEAVAADVEPLRLDDEPLLLLDDDQAGVLGEGAADNSRCHVCHMNYMQDSLALTHARAKIGCAECHGESDAHIADESWAWGGNGTAPDVMYRLEEVNPFCMNCHGRDTIDMLEHEALFEGTSEKKYCTDCHGDHRLAYRRCKWK